MRRAPPHTAEAVEGRALAQGKPAAHPRGRTQGRSALPRALDRIRTAARRTRGRPVTALWHHVYDSGRLRAADYGLTREAAPGLEGQTWGADGEALEANLRALSDRRQRGAYHAQPVERGDSPKRDGRPRPLGIPPLEDQRGQRATVEGLNASYAGDCRGVAYGCRPGRSPHKALAAVPVGIEKRSINGGLDAAIRGFWDAIDHAWLLTFVAHRVGARRVGRHRRKWRKAGGLEAGQWHAQAEGTPPGGSVSPLAANLSLHDVLARWADRWRRRHARGEGRIVRAADALIVGVEHRDAAERVWGALRERCQQCNLARHPAKRRRIAFGRYAADRRQRRGQGKPATVDFLGVTPICRQTSRGKLTVRRKTVAQRLRQKLQEVKAPLRQRLHWPIPQQGAGLRSGRLGHSRYDGVPRNGSLLTVCRETGRRSWCRPLRRRSQRDRLTWQRMDALADRWRPPPRSCPP